MKTAISDLWNGNIAPCEHCGEQKVLLEQSAQLWEDYLLRMMELAFRDGFTIGSRLAAEVCSQR